MTKRTLSLLSVPLAVAVLVPVAGCGGGGQASAPSQLPTPVPTPVPKPEPSPEPTPVATSCSPEPPPISRVRVSVHLKGPEFITLDATALVGPDVGYCARIGFTDGRSFCPVRPEGDPMREECEAYAIGRAEDTGRPGPTWTREDGEHCTTFEETYCANSPSNQHQLWVYCGGIKYVACSANGTCGDVMTDHDQHLEKCIGSPGSTWPSQ